MAKQQIQASWVLDLTEAETITHTESGLKIYAEVMGRGGFDFCISTAEGDYVEVHITVHKPKLFSVGTSRYQLRYMTSWYESARKRNMVEVELSLMLNSQL